MSLEFNEMNKGHTRLFLERLDKNASYFTFQTFDDEKDRKKKDQSLTRVLHGSLDEVYDELVELNKKGAGIFVAVNEIIKGERRTVENVNSLRTFFSDKDDGENVDSPVPPSMVVQSKRGVHNYYVLENKILREQGTDQLYKNMQLRIAAYLKSDELHDVTRVMRLPGFYHMKDKSDPYRVHIKSTNENTFNINTLGKFFPDVKSADTRSFTEVEEVNGENRGVLEKRTLDFIKSSWSMSKGSNGELIKAISNIKFNAYTMEECQQFLEQKGEALDRNTMNQIRAVYRDPRYEVSYIVTDSSAQKKNSMAAYLEGCEIFSDIANNRANYSVNKELKTVEPVDILSVAKCIGKKKADEKIVTSFYKYMPDVNSYVTSDKFDRPVFNTYRPPEWKKKLFFMDKDIEMVDDIPEEYDFFLTHLFGGCEESKEFALDWMANAIQGKRNITILSLVGSTRGIGKSLLCSINAKMHGHSNYSSCSQSVISKEFNSQVADKTFINFDEVSIENQSEFERIKSYTNETISVEGKGVDSKTCKFYGNILLSNNNTDSLKGVSPSDDRQFSIPNLTKTPLLQVDRYKSRENITKLYEDEELVYDFARYLYHRKTADTSITRHLKTTENYNVVVKDSQPDWAEYILNDVWVRMQGLCMTPQNLITAAKVDGHNRMPGYRKMKDFAKKNNHKIIYAERAKVKFIFFSKEGETAEEFKDRVSKYDYDQTLTIQKLEVNTNVGVVYEQEKAS